MNNIDETKMTILRIIQAAHLMQYLGNYVDGRIFADQRTDDAPTSEDGVYGHGAQSLSRIRGSGLVSPGQLDFGAWCGVAECNDWDDVDRVIWDNAYSEPTLEQLAQLYVFNDAALEEEFGHRWL